MCQLLVDYMPGRQQSAKRRGRTEKRTSKVPTIDLIKRTFEKYLNSIKDYTKWKTQNNGIDHSRKQKTSKRTVGDEIKFQNIDIDFEMKYRTN